MHCRLQGRRILFVLCPQQLGLKGTIFVLLDIFVGVVGIFAGYLGTGCSATNFSAAAVR